MNRDTIKYLAIIAMVCNHYALVFLETGIVLYEVLVDIGYFTAVTMCYFLVEGYHYTKDRKKYGQRLFVFAVLSQIPYMLALPYKQLNMMFTLFICYCILQVMDSTRSEYDKNRIVFLLSTVTVIADWALLAPLFTILFAKSRGDKQETRKAFGISAAALVVMNLLTFAMEYPVGEAVLKAFCSGIGILVAGLVLTCLYNGKQAARGRTFSKWFFYIFYPAHLLALGFLRWCV